MQKLFFLHIALTAVVYLISKLLGTIGRIGRSVQDHATITIHKKEQEIVFLMERAMLLTSKEMTVASVIPAKKSSEIVIHKNVVSFIPCENVFCFFKTNYFISLLDIGSKK